MSKPQINWAEAFEDGGITLMDRVYGNSGSLISQAGTTSVILTVYECDTQQDVIDADGTALVGVGGSLTVSSLVYDSLQTALPWSKDSTGYNFRYNAAAAALPTGGKWYRFEFQVAPASGAVYWLVWGVYAKPVAGS